MSDTTAPDLEGKLVFFYVNNGGNPQIPVHYPLESPRFELQHGRMFVVGRIPKVSEWGPSQWYDVSLIAIPWDVVLTYLVYDSIEQYEKSRQPSSGTSRAKGWLGRSSV